MSRASELRAQLTSIDELHRVVTAMRSLAAAQVQNADRALPGIRRYAEVIGDALSRARSLIETSAAGAAPSSLPPRLIVVCAERGFVGAFNEHLIERAAIEPEATRGRVWILGTRGAGIARTRGLPVEWTAAMPSHAAGVYETARMLAAEIERRVARGELDRVAIVGAARRRGGLPSIERRQLLPLEEPAMPRTERVLAAPVHHLPALELLASIVGERVAGELVSVLMESFGSENAARLQAMEAARQHIEHKQQQLRDDANRLRQEDITSELLDVITGAEAVRSQTS